MKKRIIKRYSNRKLYDTMNHRTITLSQLIGYVKEGINFDVIDQTTGNNMTNYVLSSSLANIKLENETIINIIKQYS